MLHLGIKNIMMLHLNFPIRTISQDSMSMTFANVLKTSRETMKVYFFIAIPKRFDFIVYDCFIW